MTVMLNFGMATMTRHCGGDLALRSSGKLVSETFRVYGSRGHLQNTFIFSVKVQVNQRSY